MKRILLLTFILLTNTTLNSQDALALGLDISPDTLPVPKGMKDMLFYLQRDPNANTVVYELNKTEDGELNEQDPVHVFWIRYADDGEKKELNYLQRRFAFGLHTKKLDKDNYELRLVSYSDIPLYLRKTKSGKFRVFTTIDEEDAILERIFVRIDGGSFWSPNILYVELKGRNTLTGKEVTERFKP